MHLRSFDRNDSRRVFLDKTRRTMIGAGVLAAAWSTFCRSGSIASAYPDELLSIEEYSRGKLKAGDLITRDNVEAVAALLDPVRLHQVQSMGRTLQLVPTTTDIGLLLPHDYVEATIRNRGRAVFDATQNVIALDGRPWIGGNPFPEPSTPLEVMAAHTLSWGRHDASFYATREFDLDENGNVAYQYASCWAEMAAVGRVTLDPKPYWPGHEGKLRYQSVFFVAPTDIRGTAYLNVWSYDQSRFPELYGYIPAFKRVRQFPANQRFEPLNPGSELYLSDAWAAGDPFLTWGNYRVVHLGPLLGAVSRGWNSTRPDWSHGTHGGPKGNMFWDTAVELVPEVIVIEAEPTGFPRAPIGRKRVWFDARTLLPLAMTSYDRRGQIFRHFDGAYSMYDDGRMRIMDGRQPYWSWTTVHAYNVQTNRMTRIEQVSEVAGGHRMRVNDENIYEKYLTVTALRRLGG